MNNVAATQFEPGVLPSIWRYRWLFLAFVVVFGALGYASVLLQTSEETWSASSVLVVEDPRTSALFDTVPNAARNRYVANQVAVLRSTPVAERSSELLADEGLDFSPQDVLAASEIIATTSASEVIEIVFQADEEASAIAGANAIAQAYQEVRRSEARTNYQSSIDQLDAFIATTNERLAEIQTLIDAQLESGIEASLLAQYTDAVNRLLALEGSATATAEDIDAVRAEIAALQAAVAFRSPQQSDVDLLVQEQQNLVARRSRLTQERDEIAIDSELLGSGVLLFSPAATATPPTKTSPWRNTLLGLVVGSAAGAMAAYFLALRRRRFSDAGQPALILSAPLLASVSQFKEERITSSLPILDAPASEAAESFRFAAAALRHRFSGPARYPDGTQATGPGADTPWIAFVSASAGDGKTIVTANTALAAANDGQRVLLIDADIADQDLTRILNGHAKGHVSISLPGGRGLPVREIEGMHSGRIHLVSLRSDDPADAARVISESFPRALSAAESGEYDFVIVDVPPLLQIAYAGTIASQAGTAVVVVPHNGRVAEVEEEKDRLDLSSTSVAGYVYNKAPRRTEGAGPGSSLLAHRSALRGHPASSESSDVVEIGPEVKEQHDAVHGG